MCRMYSVMLLLVLLYVVRRVRNPNGVLGNCILLGLAGNTDLTGEVLEAACLMEDGFEAGAKIGLFVVRRDHEAEQRSAKIAKLYVNTLNFGGRYRPD